MRTVIGYALTRHETQRVVDLYESNDKKAIKVSALDLQWHVASDDETLHLGAEHKLSCGQMLPLSATTVDKLMRNVRHVLDSMQIEFKSERFGLSLMEKTDG